MTHVARFARHDIKVLRSEATRTTPPSMAPPPPVIPGFEDFDDAVLGTGLGQHQFIGNWPIFDSTTDYLIGHHYTTETGATDTFRFVGSQYQLFDTIGPRSGIAGITNDTAAEVGVDQYQTSVYSDDTLVYTSPDLGFGTHTVVKRNTGTRNAASGGNEVSSDRIRVWQTFSQTPTATVPILANPPPEPPPPEPPPPEPPPPPPPPPPTTSPTDISRLQVVGRFVRNASGANVRLRGVSGIFVRDQENFREGINQFVDRHTNVGTSWYSQFYRIPVNPGAYLANPTAYIVYIDKMVAKCKARLLYCVIDWHDFGRVTTDSGALSDYSTVGASGAPQYGGQKARTETFWSVIAPRYKNETHVMYEVFNEPIQVNQTGGVQATWDRWRTQVQPTVNMIRGLAPDTIIMVGGPQYSQWMGGAVSNPIQGTNIAYVWHGYPGAFYPDANGNNQLNRTGWTIHAGVTAERYPVFVTEWGYGHGTPNETSGDKQTYFDPFIIFLEDYLMHSTAWNADYDYYPEMYAGSSYDVLSEFGQGVKEYLYARRNG